MEWKISWFLPPLAGVCLEYTLAPESSSCVCGWSGRSGLDVSCIWHCILKQILLVVGQVGTCLVAGTALHTKTNSISSRSGRDVSCIWHCILKQILWVVARPYTLYGIWHVQFIMEKPAVKNIIKGKEKNNLKKILKQGREMQIILVPKIL